MNTFERVENSELEERIKDKTVQIKESKIIHHKFWVYVFSDFHGTFFLFYLP